MSNVSSFLASMEESLGGAPIDVNSFKPRVVSVGEDITSHVTMFGKKIQVGSGILHQGKRVIATQAGILYFDAPNTFWVEHGYHRYVPRDEDHVIGVIVDSFVDSYKIDINSTSLAQLPCLAFDGASKRNKPEYSIGTLIYARVAHVFKDMEPELSCMVLNGPKKDWATGESVYGELKGGNLIQVSLSWADRLLDPENIVLQTLAKSIAFEIAIGSNGYVWINAAKATEIIVVSNAIKKSEMLNPEDAQHFIHELVVKSLS